MMNLNAKQVSLQKAFLQQRPSYMMEMEKYSRDQCDVDDGKFI